MGITQTNKETHLNFKTTILEALNHHKFIHNHHQAAQRNIFKMGAVVSCIKSLFQTIGACIMAVANGIAGMLKAIINAIASFFGIIVSCLTCGRGGGHTNQASTPPHHKSVEYYHPSQLDLVRLSG